MLHWRGVSNRQGYRSLAGFLVQSLAQPTEFSAPIKLVDLGGCEIAGSWGRGNSRAAWTYWRNSAQWHVSARANAVRLVEGQPDRLPCSDETIEHWLQGRAGSFRGFEISCGPGAQEATVLIFVDPLCTRPLYYLASDSGVSISDKLSTVVLNAQNGVEPDWGGLLEGAILGSLYSYKTTVRNAVWLAPGECIQFRGSKMTRRWKNPLPQDPSLNQAEVSAKPAETLRAALEKAVAETWIDPEMRLLLSGGLDSRIVLALASGKRKTLTLELYSKEAEMARKVAAAANSELDVVPPPDYHYPMRWAYLVTGAMHDSQYVSHLGLVRDWRARGIPGITHAYFHNTIYRGWTAAPYERKPAYSSILYPIMGRNAYYLERYSCKQAVFQRDLYNLLSDDGKAVLEAQLRELSDSLVPVVVEGYDLTFERRLMEFLPRQMYFSCMLAWYEALDVASPVFHKALWTWYALSSPRHRARDWSIVEVYHSLNTPIARLPNGNTGQPIAHEKAKRRDGLRNQFWYPPLRAAYLKLFWKPLPFQHGGMNWGTRLREPRTLAAMEQGVSGLKGNPLFDQAKLRAAMDAYGSGTNIDLVESICALSAMGQWQQLVARPESLTEHVRAVAVDGRETARQEVLSRDSAPA